MGCGRDQASHNNSVTGKGQGRHLVCHAPGRHLLHCPIRMLQHGSSMGLKHLLCKSLREPFSSQRLSAGNQVPPRGTFEGHFIFKPQPNMVLVSLVLWYSLKSQNLRTIMAYQAVLQNFRLKARQLIEKKKSYTFSI